MWGKGQRSSLLLKRPEIDLGFPSLCKVFASQLRVTSRTNVSFAGNVTTSEVLACRYTAYRCDNLLWWLELLQVKHTIAVHSNRFRRCASRVIDLHHQKRDVEAHSLQIVEDYKISDNKFDVHRDSSAIDVHFQASRISDGGPPEATCACRAEVVESSEAAQKIYDQVLCVSAWKIFLSVMVIMRTFLGQ